jgi:hypothetical protein
MATYKITLVYGDNTNVELDVKGTDTVKDLKTHLTNNLFRNQAVTSLYCGSDILSETSKLSDCAPEDSVIVATITARKGAGVPDWYAESDRIPVTTTPCSIGTCILKTDNDDKRFNLPTCSHSICAFCLSGLIDETLNKGIYRFYCPHNTTNQQEGTKYCNKEISFTTIKVSGLFGAERQKTVQKLMGKNLAMANGMKPCPKCKAFLQRGDSTSAWVRHEMCNGNGHYDFCWWCLKDWKGSGNNLFCGNAECTQRDPRLDILAKAIRINIRVGKDNKVANVPSMRACPNCFTLQERDNNGCRYTYCPCTKLFCFVCLSSAANHSSPLPCGADHWEGSCIVAAVQTKLTK